MLSPQEILGAIHEQVGQFIPEAGKSAQEDLQTHLKLIVSGVIAKLDLVSREEFDAQQAVLEKTRAKLEQLEKDMAALEQSLAEK